MTTETEGAPAPDNAVAPEAPEKEPKDVAAPEQSAEPAGETPEDGDQQGSDKLKEVKRDLAEFGKSVKKRIGEITAQKHSALARASSAENKLAQAERRITELQKYAANAPFEEQARNDYRRVALEEKWADAREELASAQQEITEANRNALSARFEEASGRINANPQEVLSKLGSLKKLSGDAVDFIIEAENGADIAQYLANNLTEADAISRLPPYRQFRELERMGTALKPPPARKATTAPPPVPVVAGNPGRSSKTTSDMSIDEMSAHLRKKGVFR